MANNGMLRAALLYADSGIPVFPCAGKVPATPNGFKDASTDETQLREWFTHGDFNMAMRPADAGIVVVDVDIGSDPAIKDQLPPTHTVRTPSGGYHYYYRSDEGFGNRKLDPKVDIRSEAGYVLVPPSTGYMIVDSQDPTPLPRWVSEKLTAKPDLPAPEVREGGEVISHKRLVDILSRINPACDYETWSKVIAACSTLTPDFDLDMPNVLVSWSGGVFFDNQEPENYCGDLYDMAGKLASFTRGDGATMGTLLYLAGMLDHETPPLAPPDYSAESWCERTDIPEPQQLLGPINRSSRVMIHAGTGLGKTHFAMALAAHLAAGKPFLHWGVPTAARVLYIDGEMPRGLMQRRIQDMHKRIGEGSLGRRLWFISRGDLTGDDDLAGLNTRDGQVQIETWVNHVKPDLIIFDNIQALTTGDLKETDSWRGVQSWCQTLKVAHIWVHHSNKDGSSYGDKSREWQMDTVISLRRVDSYRGDDLTFDLEFPKHREREPENQDRYQEGRFTMTKFGWMFTPRGKIQDPMLEDILADGPKTVRQLATILDCDPKTVTAKAEGKWAMYVMPGRPLKFAMPPSETEDF